MFADKQKKIRLSLLCMVLSLQMAYPMSAGALSIDEKALAQVKAREAEKAKAAAAVQVSPTAEMVIELEPVNRILSLIGGVSGWSATIEAAGGKILMIQPGDPLENNWRVGVIDANGITLRRGGKSKRFEFGTQYNRESVGLPPLPALP